MEKIAYLIMARNRPRQVEKLIRILNYKSDFFVHVDLKEDINSFLKLDFPNNVKFIRNRVNIFWGGYSMVEGMLELCRAALSCHSLTDKTKNTYIHFVLLSETDYVIKNARDIYNHFINNKSKQFITLFKLSAECDPIAWGKLSHWWFLDGIPFLPYFMQRWKIKLLVSKLLSSFVRRRLLDGFIYCKGSQWWALTPDCVEYLLKIVVENPSLKSFFKYSFAPDEIIFHTIIANSQFLKNCSSGIVVKKGPILFHESQNLHLLAHKDNGTEEEKFFVSYNFDEIRLSDKLFIRKVDACKSARLIDLIDSELLK